MGEVMEHAPYAYTLTDKSKIAAAFALHGNLLSFSTATPTGTMVIDPTLEWGTYFGGNNADYISDVVNGKDGKIYITGTTNSVANIATTGAYQTTYGGGSNDAFISKFEITGNCVWSTYYGTADEDAASSISKDTSGNLYIAGYTYSASGLASVGAYKMTSGGSYDAFIAGFDTSGLRIWSTYYGGPGEDGSTSIAIHCDKLNHIYLTGQTNSATGIASMGAYQPALYNGAGVGDQDAFLAQFLTNGTFEWATYFGGNFGDVSTAVTNDLAGNIYITGNTNSTVGIASAGQTANAGGYEAFLAKFNSSGNKIWSTYLGGNSDDYGLGLDCDDSANIYVAGQTLSTSGLSTVGAYQGTYGGGGQDGLLAKFNNSGTLVWSTYYGGSSEDAIGKVYTAPDGSLYVCGFTGSTGMATIDGPQPTFGGYYDGFISRFSNAGTLVWGSYIGGVDVDQAAGICGDAFGNFFVTGATTSATGIATSSAWQGAFGGGDYDGFLLKIKDCAAPVTPDSILGLVNVCAGTIQAYTTIASVNAISYNWILPSGWIGISTTDTISVIFDGNTDVIKVVAVNDCAASDTASLMIAVNALPTIPQVTSNGNILSTSQSYAAYQWLSNGQPITGATLFAYSPTGPGNYSVVVFNAAGCSDTSVVFQYATPVNTVLKNNGISLYPNPATDAVYITSAQSAWIGLYSIDGKLLRTMELFTGTNKLSLSGLSKGIYTVRFTDKAGDLIGAQSLMLSGL